MRSYRHFRPRIESLEDRLTPSWAGTPPTSIAVPTRFTSVALSEAGDATKVSSISSTEEDFYRVTTAVSGSTTFTASATGSKIDTVIGIYDTSGQLVAFNDDIIPNTNTNSSVTVDLAAGTYFFGVTNYTGSPAGKYTLTVNAPGTDDTYENNDTRSTAKNLGTLTTIKTVDNLILNDVADWFKFTTTGPGTAGSGVSISFSNAQGNLDLLLYNSRGTLIASSRGTADTETISLSGLAKGTYSVQIVGANGDHNPDYSLTVAPPGTVLPTVPPTVPPSPPSPPPPPPPPPPPSGFQITLNVTGMTSSQQTIFQQAAARWSQVIIGDIPDATYQGIPVDDVLIDASGAAIDGVNGILGQAGPDAFRSGSFLPIHGTMEFDTADLSALEQSGQLFDVILHEMGHVLGIGTIWSAKGLLSGAGGSNPLFTGTNAVAAYNQIFGTNATGVPVENSGGSGTRDSHWRESVFGAELMTGYLNSGVANPLSRVTVASLADLGYTVDMNAADAYTHP
jgi:hypothetical protein